MHQLEGGHQELQGNQTHPLMEDMVLEAVLELQEEEEEEMTQVILVEMKDQTGMKVLTLMRKRMKVVLIRPEQEVRGEDLEQWGLRAGWDQ